MQARSEPASTPLPTAASAPARSALVFGGSGQIGRPLLARLAAAGWQVTAISRRPPADGGAGLRWQAGDLDAPGTLPAQVEAIFSCGPLDAFARWYDAASIDAPRVVAFGSTSVEVKRDSGDPGERDVAARLAEAEARLFAAAARRGAAATVLRPTLVYGAGRDATLSRIAALATRLRGFALPSDACGGRQPVHVDDLAGAALACLGRASSHGRAYALPGGETLAYREMVARVLSALPGRPRLVVLPPALFRALLVPARLAGVATGFNDAALARMREDLVFDAAPAARDFGYAPRTFVPTAGMFTAPA